MFSVVNRTRAEASYKAALLVQQDINRYAKYAAITALFVLCVVPFASTWALTCMVTASTLLAGSAICVLRARRYASRCKQHQELTCRLDPWMRNPDALGKKETLACKILSLGNKSLLSADHLELNRLPDCFDLLPALKTLDVAGNYLLSPRDPLPSLPHLTSINLSDNCSESARSYGPALTFSSWGYMDWQAQCPKLRDLQIQGVRETHTSGEKIVCPQWLIESSVERLVLDTRSKQTLYFDIVEMRTRYTQDLTLREDISRSARVDSALRSWIDEQSCSHEERGDRMLAARIIRECTDNLLDVSDLNITSLPSCFNELPHITRIAWKNQMIPQEELEKILLWLANNAPSVRSLFTDVRWDDEEMSGIELGIPPGRASVSEEEFAKAFTLFNLPTNYTRAQLRQVFKDVVCPEHPDKGGDKERFQELHSAYQLLLGLLPRE